MADLIKHPQGVIDLDHVVRIGRPTTATLERGSVRAYRNVPHENIFELEMPKRTYRVMAGSEVERDDWIATLREIMGAAAKLLGMLCLFGLPQTQRPHPLPSAYLSPSLIALISALLLTQA